MIWFGLVLWHINHCRLFNAKSFLNIYIKYIWFGLVGLSFMAYTIESRLLNESQFEQFIVRQIHSSKKSLSDRTNVWRSNTRVGPIKTEGVWMIAEGKRTQPNGWTSLSNQNQLALFQFSNKSVVEWLVFMAYSTLVYYQKPNLLYTYILNMYDLVWLGFMAYQPLLVN